MQKEIFIGLVGGVGVDFDSVIYFLEKEFKAQGYCVKKIRISNYIKDIFPIEEINNENEFERIKCYMGKGTKLRKGFENKGILSYLAIAGINKIRENSQENVVYFLKSFKRPEEVDVFRKIYGRNFILLSVHSSIESRKSFFRSSGKTDEEIDELIEKDFSETDENQKSSGQDVIHTFPKAHVFLNTDNDLNLQTSIRRFVDILFGHPFCTPTIDERNMFLAKGISLRSADVSRQVGAVIANSDGDAIAIGCNDVPKFGGGLYEPDDPNDSRDFKFYKNKNKDQEKFNIVKDLLNKFSNIIEQENNYKDVSDNIKELIKDDAKFDEIYKKLETSDTKVINTLEFGRPVHAEMEAICDAARRGIKLKGSTLYCTTYPCHLCAKLILAVGIQRVVYIDPYPKSRATKLFEGVIVDSHGQKYTHSHQLSFDAFMGIAPRRYLHVFKQKHRTKEDGSIEESKRKYTPPYLKTRNSIDYLVREIVVLKKASDLLESTIKDNDLNINLDFFSESFEEANRKYNKLQNKYSESTEKSNDEVIFSNLDELAEDYFGFMNQKKK